MKHQNLSKILILLIALSLASLNENDVRADFFHYKNILIGERAAGMGGTFIAISDDPTGIYYNPAGTAFGFENYVNASANSINSSNTLVKDITPGKNYNSNSTSFSPTFFGFTQNLGKGKIGFAVVVPDSERFDQNDLLSGITAIAGSANSLLRERFLEDSTYLFGPSYAIGIGNNASVGISLMGFAQLGTTVDVQLVTFNPAANSTSSAYGIQSSYLQYASYGIIPKIGAQYMPSPKISIGLTASKAVNISNTSSTRQVYTPETTSGPIQQTGNVSNDLTVKTATGNFITPAPFIFGFGAAYFFSKSLLVTADINSFLSDPNPLAVLTTTPTLNLSGGAEFYVTEGIALRGGVYTNNANTPTIVAGGRNQLDNVNQLGFGLGISFLKPGSSLTLGSNYAFGGGKSQYISNSTNIQTMTISNLGFSLAGSYQL